MIKVIKKIQSITKKIKKVKKKHKNIQKNQIKKMKIQYKKNKILQKIIIIINKKKIGRLMIQNTYQNRLIVIIGLQEVPLSIK